MRLNRILATSFLLLAASSTRSVRADVDMDAKARGTIKSLVIVEYTVRTENASREESGQGILIQKDGVILISAALIPEAIPMDWVKDIKVRLPLKNFTTVPAKFLGRTRNRIFAFIKTDKPINAPVFQPGELVPSRLGQGVFAAAMLGKSGGYVKCVGVANVKAVAEFTHTLIACSSFGLTCGNSPVFDQQTGKFAGITFPATGEAMILRDSGGARRVELLDDEQSSAYLPKEEIEPVFKNIPTEPFDERRPWLAVDELTGLQEDVRELKKIDQVAGVMVGAVIPGETADKAGLQAQDIILTIDGKEFSDNPVPELMVMHLSREIEKHKPSDEITLGILRDGKKMDIKVKLAASPKNGSEMTHVFSPRLGIVSRDLVFSDCYTRKLPPDTKGVMVALIKTGSPSSLGSTPLHPGLLITKVDDQPIENQKQFLEIMKKAEEKTDAKEMVFVVIQQNGETQVCRIDLTK